MINNQIIKMRISTQYSSHIIMLDFAIEVREI